MRILVFHGYLLEGTGSNVYNARLAAALVELGHEVHLLCQDRHPERQPFVDAAGSWGAGELELGVLREPVRCTVYRPDIGGLLPVYVADRYEGIEARTFAECSEEEVERYIAANVAAVREVLARAEPDVALANHLVMGPAILARALAGAVPYAVKVHGSALEYTVKPEPERFLRFAREGVAEASAILVGSRHTAESLWQALGEDGGGGDRGEGADGGGVDDGGDVRARTRLGPPGVDVASFRPRERELAARALPALVERLRESGAAQTAAAQTAGAREDAFARDDLAAAQALALLDPARDRLVAFVGKLIANKGVDLLLEAWPLVLAREPAARLLVIGFGAERERLLAAAAALGEHVSDRIVFTGRLDHEELAELLPACEALVVPSIFPEAFGMVAAEAAACGAFPVSAAHSGLAEVSDTLARHIPAQAAAWLSFAIDGGAVQALAACLVGWLGADPQLRASTRAGLVQAVREHWSWQGVARGVIAAARGELDDLAVP